MSAYPLRGLKGLLRIRAYSSSSRVVRKFCAGHGRFLIRLKTTAPGMVDGGASYVFSADVVSIWITGAEITAFFVAADYINKSPY